MLDVSKNIANQQKFIDYSTFLQSVILKNWGIENEGLF